MLVNNNDARPKIWSPNLGKNWYPVRITVPANLVFCLEIWGARDNGIPPRSTPVIMLDEVTKQQHPFICKNTVGPTCFFNFTMRHNAPEVLFYRLISFKATQLLNNYLCASPHPCPVPMLSLPPHKGHFQEMHCVYASIEFVYFRLAKHAMLTKLPSCQQLSTISSGSGVIIQGQHYSSS